MALKHSWVLIMRHIHNSRHNGIPGMVLILLPPVHLPPEFLPSWHVPPGYPPPRTSQIGISPWWRHQMATFSALLALCAGNSLVTGKFPAQSQWRGAVMFYWSDGRVNNRDTGDLRRRRPHSDVTVVSWPHVLRLEYLHINLPMLDIKFIGWWLHYIKFIMARLLNSFLHFR